MTKIFLTGATGYVGGEVLSQLAASPAIYEIVCLVRTAEKGLMVEKACLRVRLVIADLDDESVIVEESRKADIVLHLASTGHIKSANAISKGLNSESRTSKATWIQISGASLFSVPEIKQNRYGEASSETFDDLQGIDEVISIIRANPQRTVDNLIIEQDASKVQTALCVAPLIYGPGHGPVNRRSVQVPEIARVTLQNGKGFQLGRGLSRWSNVHIHDLGNLICKLVEMAASEGAPKPETWGVYLPENGVMEFKEIFQRVAQEAQKQGLIENAAIDVNVDTETANTMTPHGAVLWGTNAILKSSRARQNLGWKPKGPSLEEEIPGTVAAEALRLGLSAQK